MFYDRAESTRLSIELLGAQAVRSLNFDAMRGALDLIESYIVAIQQEDAAALDLIDLAVRRWASVPL